AYDLYLKARVASQEVNVGTSVEERRRVIDLLEAAIARDPRFGLAYIARAQMGPAILGGNLTELADWGRTSKSDIAMARRLMGDDPRVLAIEANYKANAEGDIAGALQLFEAATAKGLNHPDALLNKASVLLSAGRLDESLALSQRLAELDPGNPLMF